MKRSLLTLFVLSVLLVSCSKDNSVGPTASPFAKGNLVLHVSDSFHMNDTLSDFAVNVQYRLDEAGVPHDSGYIRIPAGSNLGDVYSTQLNDLPSGGFTLNYIVPRPFVILGRKDNVGEARFVESMPVSVPSYSTKEAPVVDIWAYRPNRLVVYFNNGVTAAKGDSIMQTFGVRVLSRQLTYLDSTEFFVISTEHVANESDLKPQIEAADGVRSVFFDIYGHSYF